MPGLERAEIEHRLDRDKAAQLLRIGWLAACQDMPRKTCGSTGEGLAYGVGGHCQRPGQIVEFDVPVLHTHQPERERAEASSEARIRGELLEEGIGIEEAVGHPCDLTGRQV